MEWIPGFRVPDTSHMVQLDTEQTFCGVPAAAPTLASAVPTAGTPQNVCWVGDYLGHHVVILLSAITSALVMQTWCDSAQ